MRGFLKPGPWLAVMLLAACVAGRAPVGELDPEQQATLLREMPAFALEGRVAVRSGEEGWQANVRWRQRGAVSEVRLSGPFGAGALQLRFDGVELTLTTARGETLRGAEAQATLREQLGFEPPISQLRHWLLAKPASPDPIAEIKVGMNGRPATLQEQGWQLIFEDYRPQTLKPARVQMPRRIIATGENVRLRLVVDRWRLGKAR